MAHFPRWRFSAARRGATLGAVAILACWAATACAANPDKLWEIVAQRCVPDAREMHTPMPCRQVDLGHGYAVLKDIVGVAQYLLIPTTRVTGIESPRLLAPEAPNYWQAAWQARRFVAESLGRPMTRDAVGLEINSAVARSQTQLHIHVDCLRADIVDALRAYRDIPVDQWQAIQLDGREYRIMRLTGDDLAGRDPFRLVADGLPASQRIMGLHTILVAGATFAGAVPGFYVLDGRASYETHDPGSAERLLDHDCGVVPH